MALEGWPRGGPLSGRSRGWHKGGVVIGVRGRWAGATVQTTFLPGTPPPVTFCLSQSAHPLSQVCQTPGEDASVQDRDTLRVERGRKC